jgi:hypothetical protein
VKQIYLMLIGFELFELEQIERSIAKDCASWIALQLAITRPTRFPDC